MNTYEWVETILFFVVLLALVKPVGTFMARVYQGERTFLSPVLVPCENLLYRICGVDKERGDGLEEGMPRPCSSSTVLFVTLFAMLLFQGACSPQPTEIRGDFPGTWRSTPPSASPPTPTGRHTVVNRPPATSPRWWGLQCRTSSPPPPAWLSSLP